MALCRENIETISAYADEELGHAEREALERHLETCGSCREVLRATRLCREKMRQRFSGMTAPVHLEQRIRDCIQEEIEKERLSSRIPAYQRLFTTRLAWAALLLALAVVGVGSISFPSPAWALFSIALVLAAGVIYLRTEGIISPRGEKPTTIGYYIYDISHDAYLVNSLPKRPLEIVSSDAGETAAFLSNYVGFQVHAPRLAGVGCTMQGGRLWHTVARISSLIEYVDTEGHRISLFEIKRERIGMSGAAKVTAGGIDFYTGDAFGYNGVAWMQHNVAMGLVADLPHERLLEIAHAAARDLAQ